MKKVAFYTLGCKLNFSETSAISTDFEKRGFRKVNFHQEPDIIVINTCSVTENADKKCRKIVREAKSHAPGAFIAITGCYAQLKPKEIEEIPGVDAVLGAAEKFQLLDLIQDFSKRNKAQIFNSEISKAQTFHHAHSNEDRTRTFLKIQDGCNYNCAFCTIPLARGKSRSDTIKNVLEVANKIARSGSNEVVLSGVNIGDFGIVHGKRKERLINLLTELDKIEGIARFRISSIEPNLLSDQIIHFISKAVRFVPHFHIPLQSGNDKILKSMQRRYKSALYAERVRTIKSLMPNACIGADVIVGFPGESEEDFLKTYRFINELDISYLHVFPFSERANTRAIGYPDVVPNEVRSQRSRMLRILSEKKRRKFYEEQLGQERKVIFENQQKGGRMTGFTDNYIKVIADYDPTLINKISWIKLSRINYDGLMEAKVTLAETEALPA